MQLNEIKKVMRVTYNKWLLNGYTNGMSYLLKIKKDFETAAWTTGFKSGKKVNYIYIGDKAIEMSNEVGNKKRLLENLLYHEFGHSKFTTDKFELIDRELKEICATFELFNVFEDFRMEQRVRELTSHRFNWFNYIDPKFMGVGYSQPESLLLALKNAECFETEEYEELIRESYFEACKKDAEEKGDERSEIEIISDAEDVFEKVLNYFAPKIIEVKTALNLMPVIKEWLDEFYDEDELKRQQEQQEALEQLAQQIAEAMQEAGMQGQSVPGSGLEMPTQSGDGSGSKEEDGSGSNQSSEASDEEGGDLQEAKKAEQNGEPSEELDNNSSEVAGDAKQKPQKRENTDKKGGGDKRDDVELNSVSITEFSSADIWQYGRREGEEVDRKAAKKLLPPFEKFLKSDSVKTATTRPSKRLSTRNLIQGRDKIYKRKTEVSKDRKKISLVIDCSGSMWNVMPEMKKVVWVINELAGHRKIEGTVTLSAAQGYETFKLPIAKEILDGISGYSGSEGLSYTFEAIKHHLKKQDYVFCLTDGDINDRAIDKKSLGKMGIKPIGIYIGQEAKNLKRWFDKYVNRQDAKSTVDEIVRKMK